MIHYVGIESGKFSKEVLLHMMNMFAMMMHKTAFDIAPGIKS